MYIYRLKKSVFVPKLDFILQNSSLEWQQKGAMRMESNHLKYNYLKKGK